MGENKHKTMKDLLSIQERVNKLFEDVMDSESDAIVLQKTWSPLVDIYEMENEYVVKAELPEVRHEELDIQVEKNVLTIKGERVFKRDNQKENFHRMERKYGCFKRSFLLPTSIDQDKIKANMEDGILTVILPKKEEKTPMQIEITDT